MAGGKKTRPGRRAARLAFACLLVVLAGLPQLAVAQTFRTVEAGSAIIPSGIGVGGSFRLLFVTQAGFTATASDIDTYNTRVQTAATNGHTNIQAFSSEFRALASTAGISARDNTRTNLVTASDTDAPIYWLSNDESGAKVADGYADLYDNSWDSGALTHEAGTSRSVTSVWTGTHTNGEGSSDNYLGIAGPNARYGNPHNQRSEISAGNAAQSINLPLYGLSPILTVTDTSAPIITLNGSTTINLNVGDTYTDPGFTASDDADGDLTVSVVVGGDTVNTNTPGTYRVTYNVMDSANNPATEVTRTVIVSAAPSGNTPPTATAGADQTVNEGASVTLTGTGSDSDGTVASISWAGTGAASTIPLTGAGTTTATFTAPPVTADTAYTFTLTVTDDDGATATARVEILVRNDGTAPVITLNGEDTIDLDVGATYTDPGFTASDDVDGDLTASVQVSGDTVDTDTLDTYVVTYDVSDTAGNAATQVTRTVIVSIDTLNPEETTAIDTAVLTEVASAIAAQTTSGIAGRIAQVPPPVKGGQGGYTGGPHFNLGGQSSLGGVVTDQWQALANGTINTKQLLGNSDFLMPLNAANGASGDSNAQLAFWGRGGYRNMDGDSDELDWDGELFSVQVGLDARFDRVLVGLAASWSEAEFDYLLRAAAGAQQADARGEYELDLNSVNPYVGWSSPDGRTDLWLTLGYGEGELTISPESQPGDETISDMTRDLTSKLLAVAASGEVFQGSNGTSLRLKGEATMSEMEVDANTALGIGQLDLDARQLRLGLELSKAHDLESGAQLIPSLEIGARYDGGEGETGTGTVLGMGLRRINAAKGLTLEGKVHGLAGRGDYTEWGVEGLIRLETGRDGKGLSFTLSPGYGNDNVGSVQQVWQREWFDAGGQGDTRYDRDYQARINAHLGYGLTLRDVQGIFTPYSEMTLSNGSSSHRVGVRWESGRWFNIDLLTEQARRDNARDERGILLQAEVLF